MNSLANHDARKAKGLAKKTPAIAAAVRPVDRLGAKAHEDYESAKVEYEADLANYEARCDAIQADIKSEARKKDGAGTVR